MKWLACLALVVGCSDGAPSEGGDVGAVDVGADVRAFDAVDRGAFDGGAVDGDAVGGASDAADPGPSDAADPGPSDAQCCAPLDSGPPPDAGPLPPTGPWRPSPGTSWQWQLTGNIDTSLDVEMYDVDLFDVPDATLDRLRADGRVVICYFSAGSHEDWRADAAAFPRAAIGDPLDDWPGERWVDVRNAGVRAVMAARLDHAVERGCHGVEPDNVDAYDNDSGFPLRAADQLDYNRWLAREAHARGLSVGLKNDLEQVRALVDDFDWALNEECLTYDECEELLPFIRAGKAVFHVEYEGDADTICRRSAALGFDTLVKRWDLDAWRRACP